MTAIRGNLPRLPAILFVFQILMLPGCNFSGTNFNSVWIGDHIDQKKRDEIGVLDKKFFLGFKNNDAKAVRSVMADTLVRIMGSDLDSVISQANPFFQTDGFSVLDEYNVQNTTAPSSNTLSGSDAHGNNYRIVYTALNKEMYVSLFLVGSKKTREFLVINIYGKYHGTWKLNIFQIGLYSFYGKTAMDYFKMAKQNYSRSYLADVMCELPMADACVRPAKHIFRYEQEKEYKIFVDSASEGIKASYHFPFTLDRVPGKPQVFNILPKLIDEGYFPMVLYVSKINLKDTASLKAEYEKVKGEVQNTFNGISEGKKYTLYQAYNKIPDGVHPLPTYTFLDKQ